MKKESLTVSAVIPAGPNDVFAAWMSAKGHSAMTGSKAAVSARVGGKFTAWDGYISGTTVELVPGSRIVQSWRTTDFADGDPDSTLTVTLEQTKTGTRVTFKHVGIPAGQRSGYREGWIDYYFKPMKEYFSRAR
jgi:activator of HSP90 ATPase